MHFTINFFWTHEKDKRLYQRVLKHDVRLPVYFPDALMKVMLSWTIPLVRLLQRDPKVYLLDVYTNPPPVKDLIRALKDKRTIFEVRTMDLKQRLDGFKREN